MLKTGYPYSEMLRVTICLLTGVLLTVRAVAESVPPAGGADPLIQSARQQQLLRTHTEKIGDQLQALIADFQSNGLAGAEVQTLQTIAGSLTRLTDKEMQRVVELLQAARRAADAGTTQRRVVEAYAGQQSILLEMRQLVAAYRRRQELQEIATRFLALADRQGVNLHWTVAFAEAERDSVLPTHDETHRAALAAQASEQDAIGAEVRIAVGQLETFAKQPASREIAAPVRQTLATIATNQLLPLLNAAVAGLTNGQRLSAAGHEKNIRDQLRNLARLLTRPADPADLLKEALTDLDRAIRDESQVADDSRAWRAADPAKPNLEERQAKLVDRVDGIRQATENLAPPAEPKLLSALDDMQRARAELHSPDPRPAERTARAAVAKLNEARQALAAALAQAEKNSTPATAPTADLRQADQELKKLIGDQEKLRQDTQAAAASNSPALPALASAEAKLQQAAQALQRSTATLSPAAAQALNEAAQQMQLAQASLAQGQNAAPVQQAALGALQQARQELQPELAKAEQAEAAAALQQGQQSIRPARRNGTPAQATKDRATNPAASQPGSLEPPGAAVRAQAATGASAYLGLPARDRQAIQQSQGEKYPAEYGQMIEQYLRNLAEQSSGER